MPSWAGWRRATAEDMLPWSWAPEEGMAREGMGDGSGNTSPHQVAYLNQRQADGSTEVPAALWAELHMRKSVEIAALSSL